MKYMASPMLVPLLLTGISVQASGSMPLQSRPDTVKVSGTVSCQDCRISARLIGTLRAADTLDIDPVVLSVARLRNGSYLATGIGTDRSISRFSREGAFQGLLGRVGNGPGEFVLPRRIILGRYDSLFVIDKTARRISVLSPRGSFVRSLSVGQIDPVDIVELPAGELLLVGLSFSRDGSGFPLHELSRDGSRVRPFGVPLQHFDPRRRADLYREVAVTNDSGVWSAHVNRYLIERITPSGVVTKVLERPAEWFRPWETNTPPVREPPKPAVARVAVDSVGRLWVFLAVARSDFKPLAEPAPSGGRSAGEAALPPILDIYDGFDTLIEVLDPVRGLLVSSLRLRGYPFEVQPFPHVALLDRSKDATPVLRVLQLGLEDGTARRGRRGVPAYFGVPFP